MHKALSFLFVILFFFNINSKAASALRSDTIDIRKTIIDFTITDFVSKIISAKATLDIKSLMNNVNELTFDLEGLIVDSVKVNGSITSFNHFSPTLKIPLTSSVLNINDTALIDVYYHGVPIADALWGGFSFVGNYGFQMGVGFNAQPHSFGRTWHPCFDNFVERSSYEFFITTEDTKAGICNGLLIDSVTNTANNTKTWHWKLDEQIPSYLACVAVSNYVFVKKNLTGNAGNTDALITCEAVDTNKVHGSFANLQQSFTMLESRFGTHSWSRVGYSLVPFSYGAMEHATNISIGKFFIDGTLNYETLIAHELSHHWWGDLVTCSTAGDMWLNEGFASYCEALHTEQVYGKDAYTNEIKLNHFNVLSEAHVSDDGYRSIANMDSMYTYGMTVYNKGQDAIHSLRTYMGDSLFFSTLTSFLNSHKFQSINTLQLRDYLSSQSGINLNNYFDNWILAPGFTHFSMDSSKSILNGSSFDVSVFLRQRKHKSTNYYEGVPLEIAFYDSLMTPHIRKVFFTGRCIRFDVNLPFNPLMIVIDPDSKISDAVTEEERIIKAIGQTNLIQAKCNVKTKGVVSSNDSTLIHIEHHWVAPDRFKNPSSFPGYVLCDNRYWKVVGINLANIQGTLQFQYDASSTNNYLDSSWIKNTEDSIRLFYRMDATEEWQFANDSLKTGGSLTDKYGNMYAKEIKAGEYSLGIKRSGYTDPIQTDAPSGGCVVVTNLSEVKVNTDKKYTVYPNPTSGILNIEFYNSHDEVKIELYDMLGHILYSLDKKCKNLLNASNIEIRTSNIEFSISGLLPGIYYLKMIDIKSGEVFVEKVVKE